MRCTICSKESIHVVRSYLVSEVYAFADCFEFAITIQKDLEYSLKQNVPLPVFPKSKSIFKVIKQCKIITDTHVMTDI